MAGIVEHLGGGLVIKDTDIGFLRVSKQGEE